MVERLTAFRRTIDLCFRAHPYYRKVFGELGLQRKDLDTPENLVRLPVVDKAVWMANPEQFRLKLEDLDDLSIQERSLWNVIYTAGSMDHPTPFYDTSHDHYARMAQMKRFAELTEIGQDDVVANLFPLTAIQHQGFLSAQYGAQGAGARMVAVTPGRGDEAMLEGRHTEAAVRFVETHRATVLWGIATFVRRLVMCAQDIGADLSAVRLVFAMGEACPQPFREDLKARLEGLGASGVTVQNGYGFTEMQGPTYQCREGGAFHLPCPEFFHLEIVDSETHEPMPHGEEGLVVISHLNRRGTVLLRYALGDLSRLMVDACPECGKTGPRFVCPPRRRGRMVKIKGLLVNPDNLDEVLRSIEGVEEYQSVVTKADAADPFSMDILVVRLACAPEVRETIEPIIRDRLIQSIEITPRIEFTGRDDLMGDDGRYKFKRFVDQRSEVV